MERWTNWWQKKSNEKNIGSQAKWGKPHQKDLTKRNTYCNLFSAQKYRNILPKKLKVKSLHWFIFCMRYFRRRKSVNCHSRQDCRYSKLLIRYGQLVFCLLLYFWRYPLNRKNVKQSNLSFLFIRQSIISLLPPPFLQRYPLSECKMEPILCQIIFFFF